MKISMNVDLTPAELRKLLGLPDVEPFNENLMSKIQERMEAGMDGYDPLTLFKPYLAGSAAGMDLFSKWMTAAMGSGGGKPES
ncbi:MAG: DUF6489 family protein [Gammaproteobacteria bacterium]